MTSRMMLRTDCSVGEQCAELHRSKKGWIEVTGYLLDHDGQRVGDAEATVDIPDRILPEVASLDVPDLGEYIAARHRTDLLRVQTLDYYGVASDGDDYQRWLSGAQVPISEGRRSWADKLRSEADRGRRRRCVHVVREPLTDYLRYQFEVGYVYNSDAGQDIRILVVEDDALAAHVRHVGDFNVIEHRDVVRSRYDVDGSYSGAVQASSDAASGYAALAEMLWASATPFTAWWAQHRQYHRAKRAA